MPCPRHRVKTAIPRHEGHAAVAIEQVNFAMASHPDNAVIARHEAIHGLPRRYAPRSDGGLGVIARHFPVIAIQFPVIARHEAIYGLPRRFAPRSDGGLGVIARHEAIHGLARRCVLPSDGNLSAARGWEGSENGRCVKKTACLGLFQTSQGRMNKPNPCFRPKTGFCTARAAGSFALCPWCCGAIGPPQSSAWEF